MRYARCIVAVVGWTWFVAGSSISAQDPAGFDALFQDKTLRIDYNHTGTATTEIISLDQVYEQGPWAGSRTNLIDTLNLGKYMARVYDAETGGLLYSRGFSSIYGEWETTQDALDEIARTFHESVLIPYPRMPIRFELAKRDRFLAFQPIFSTAIDPASRFVNRENRALDFEVFSLWESGPAHERVDFLVLGDGYAKEDSEKFRRDAERWKEVMLSTSPFSDLADRINIRAIEVISEESGIDEPRQNVWKNTALGTTYNALDLPRYVLTFENKALRDIASAASYDFLYILVNSNRYGGGGIYNLYATGMSGVTNPDLDFHIPYMFTHEFGHSFGGLGDEYYSSTTAYVDFYPPGVEPWEPNVTALNDPGNLKWKEFVDFDTPLPTPWPKAHFDSLETVRQSLDREAAGYYERWRAIRGLQTEKMAESPDADKVGAFEGSGYSSTGLYRPASDCRMFSLSLAPFDRVCSNALERVIRFYSE